MNFANPEYLYLLILLPVILVVFIYSNYRRKKDIEKYGDPGLVGRFMPSKSNLRIKITFWAAFIAVALIITALARPRYGEGKQTMTTKGAEVVIALDISNSMLAEDITPNRLEKSKMIIRRLAKQLKGNRIALIVFAGDAFVQMPITNDYLSVEMFLESITPELIELQGTDLAKAIDISARSFSANEYIGKAIIVITDGENHEGGAEEAAKRAREKGMNLFILGVGTEQGSRIPNGSNDFIRNSNGDIVISRLNEEMAKKIAQAGEGTYIRVDNTSTAQDILSAEFDKLAKEEVTVDIYTRYNELFTVLVVMAMAILLADIILNIVLDITERRKRK